jgi:hypothetical protein
MFLTQIFRKYELPIAKICKHFFLKLVLLNESYEFWFFNLRSIDGKSC